MAQGAALEEVANIKFRRLLAHKKSFRRADFAIGVSVLFYKATSRKGAPRWRRPMKISGIQETEVARYCVRKKAEGGEANWNPAWETRVSRDDSGRTSGCGDKCGGI